MKRKMGRPPIPRNEYKGENLSLRMNSAEAKAVREAIKKSGKSKPEWLREALLKAARE